jgi:hypothetical protein
LLRSHQVDFGLHGRDALELHVKGQLDRFKRGLDPVEPLGCGMARGQGTVAVSGTKLMNA